MTTARLHPLEQTIVDLNDDTRHRLNTYLCDFVNEERQQKIKNILSQRTRKFTVVLENIYQAHNASAVIRSCDCFGIQNIHAIETGNKFDINTGVVQGANKWVSLVRHRSTEDCFEHLKETGYRLLGMSLREGSRSITDVDFNEPLALCYGSEEPGLTEKAHDLVDELVYVPMDGFTQSLNVSVTVGISLFHLRQRLNKTSNWQLNAKEAHQLETLWLARSTSAGRQLVKQFLDAI